MQYDSGVNPEFPSSGAAGAGSMPYSVDNALSVQSEGKGKRAIGFLIDMIPALFIGLLNLLPIVGWMAHGFLSACYWLLRDITGSSPGKMVMGSVVVSQDGREATMEQRILRNVPFAIPGILGLIPVIGIFFEVPFGVFILIVEVILLFATGRRLGDRLAGTTVIRK